MKTIDLLSSKTTVAAFQVQAVNAQPSVSVILGVGTIYFPGDTAIGSILVTSGGTPVGPGGVTIQSTLTRPDNTVVKLNATSLGPEVFRFHMLFQAQPRSGPILSSSPTCQEPLMERPS